MKAVTITKDRMKDFKLALEKLTENMVYVGIPEADNARDDDAPVGNALIGYVSEFGSPANNVPARPFLVPGVFSVQAEITDRYARGAKLALEGKVDAVEKTHNAVGLIAQNSVQNGIREGIPPPLADSTIAGRKSRGRTGTTPLIDTAQFLKSITYVVRRKT